MEETHQFQIITEIFFFFKQNKRSSSLSVEPFTNSGQWTLRHVFRAPMWHLSESWPPFFQGLKGVCWALQWLTWTIRANVKPIPRGAFKRASTAMKAASVSNDIQHLHGDEKRIACLKKAAAVYLLDYDKQYNLVTPFSTLSVTVKTPETRRFMPSSLESPDSPHRLESMSHVSVCAGRPGASFDTVLKDKVLEFLLLANLHGGMYSTSSFKGPTWWKNYRYFVDIFYQ